MAKWQRFRVSIPTVYNPVERKAIANEIIELIIKRSKEGLDKNNEPFPSYSPEYKKSFQFKTAGKSSKPNLTLTGETLNSLELISHSSGTLLIGYNKRDKELNGKVEGNVIGSYGKKSGNEEDARDFLGISDKDLETILKKFPKGEKEQKKATRKKAIDIVTAFETARGNL